MLQRPAVSTLFPYTTLFRSRPGRVGPPSRTHLHPGHQGDHRPRREHLLGGRGEDGDRKSTRLNSSHTVISYAVFCLKKKTQISTTTPCQRQRTKKHNP